MASLDEKVLDDGAVTHLEEFLALVAHEVRTPLTVVKGAVATLRGLDNDADGSARREMVEMIERNVDLAILLMGRMELAREVEKDTVLLSKEPVDLSLLVGQSVDDLRLAILNEHPVTVASEGEVAVLADPTALREIVFNVLSNAAKYSAQAAPIEVTVGHQGDEARVVVRNHGGGVAPGDTDLIFEKFFQLDGVSAGVGLGLFISRGLARAHGGDLCVQPAAQSGSEFVLTLPAA